MSLSGVITIPLPVFEDARGNFCELHNARRYQETLGDVVFVQDNLSRSSKGVVRGLHFQQRFPQGKLVTVLQGRVFDVVVDLRRDSSTFGEWEGFELCADNPMQLYVPPGFAHGFAALSDNVVFHYKCTAHYVADDQCGLRWDDPILDIPWPVKDPIISAKDQELPFLGAMVDHPFEGHKAAEWGH